MNASAAKIVLSAPNPESAEDKLKTERATLEAFAFRLIARRREVRMQLGRTFIRIKATLKRGLWESYFADTFAECISLRTAQRYMDQVHSSEADDKVSLFKPAKDPQAVKVRDATARAEAEMGELQNGRVRLESTFKLPLSLSADEQEATRKLLKSPDWPRVQREIIIFLKQLCVKFGVVNSEPDALEGKANDGDGEAR